MSDLDEPEWLAFDGAAPQSPAQPVDARFDRLAERAGHHLPEPPDQAGQPSSGDAAALALLFRAHPQALLVVDTASQRILDANAAAHAQYRWADGAWRGQDLATLRTDDENQRELRQQLRWGPATSPWRGVWQHRRSDGSVFNVHVSSQPLLHQGREARLTLLRDLTGWLDTVAAREQALHALRRSEANLHAAQALSRVGSYQYDVAERRMSGTPQLYRLIGLDPAAELTPAALLAAIDPSDQAAFRRVAHEVRAAGQVAHLDLRGQVSAGVPAWLALRVEPETDRHGRVIRVHGTLQDIGQAKQHALELAELSARLRDLSAQTEHRLAAERKRIAGNLHDGLGQLLSTVKLRAQMLNLPDGATAAQAGAVATIGGLIDDALDMVRDFTMHLRPPALEFGLIPALEWLVGEFRITADLDCTLQAHDPLGRLERLDDDPTQDLFRIVQESLGNIARHAAARSVRVDVRVSAAQVFVSVADDGVGFDPAEALSKGHFGLFGMHERALRLNAVLEIDSRPGRGCRVLVSMPWAWSVPNAAEVST